MRVYKGHRSAATCVAVSGDGSTAFTGSKDCSIIRWDVETGAKSKYHGARGRPHVHGHTAAVLSVALSPDGRYLASGSSDKTVRIWDLRLAPADAQVHCFQKHRDSVSALAFRLNSQQLFSGSFDRTINLYSLETTPMSCMQTLYGHQDKITGIDSCMQERAVSCGGDRSVRQWKIESDSQLVFKGNNSRSIDSVCMLSEDKFVTCSQDGSMSAWIPTKKKPCYTVSRAHGGYSKWLVSVGCVKFSDVIASGSNDGVVKLWKWDTEHKRGNALVDLETPLHVKGFVNGLAFSDDGGVLVAAVGKTHKHGRWGERTQGHHGLAAINLKPHLSQTV